MTRKVLSSRRRTNSEYMGFSVTVNLCFLRSEKQDLSGLARTSFITSQTTEQQTQEEEGCACDKHGKARRVIPRVIDIFTKVQKRPKKERASSEILKNPGELIRDR